MADVCRRSARASRPLLRLAGAVALAMAATSATAAVDPARSADSLRASYAALRDDIEHSAFAKPLRLESSERANTLAGDVHAVIDFPFERVRAALGDVRNWCEILILHPNIEQCRVAAPMQGGDASLAVDVGRARVPVRFSYRVAATDAGYLYLRLGTEDGPFGTTDYRIDVEAAPLDAGRTIVHFAFSHGYGTRARLAMRAYLATLGRDKIGFTVLDRAADGRARYVRDFRGALERNVMRYYLAIESYLDSLSAPPQQQREARLRRFFSYTKRYSPQLSEDDEFLDRKHAQLARQPLPS